MSSYKVKLARYSKAKPYNERTSRHRAYKMRHWGISYTELKRLVCCVRQNGLLYTLGYNQRFVTLAGLLCSYIGAYRRLKLTGGNNSLYSLFFDSCQAFFGSDFFVIIRSQYFRVTSCKLCFALKFSNQRRNFRRHLIWFEPENALHTVCVSF